MWLKNQARHAHLYFELKIVVTCSILELEKILKAQIHEEAILVGVCLLHFCSWMYGFGSNEGRMN